MTISKNDILFWIALICAVWFVFAGMFWVYFAALIIGYPFGLASYIIWKNIKSENRPRTKLIPIILSIGLALSLLVFVALVLFG
jgi:hypothetical protein